MAVVEAEATPPLQLLAVVQVVVVKLTLILTVQPELQIKDTLVEMVHKHQTMPVVEVADQVDLV
jgi:hypothetical protein